MLALTKKTSYGLLAMSHLAAQPADRLLSARQIAQECRVPLSLLMNAMKVLAGVGYVESVRGPRGGYRLARRPEDVNLADLVATLEGPVREATCLSDPANQHECTQTDMARCPVVDPVHRVHRRLNDFLRKVTLAELAEVGTSVSLTEAAPQRAARPGGASADDAEETPDLRRGLKENRTGEK